MVDISAVFSFKDFYFAGLSSFPAREQYLFLLVSSDSDIVNFVLKGNGVGQKVLFRSL